MQKHYNYPGNKILKKIPKTLIILGEFEFPGNTATSSRILNYVNSLYGENWEISIFPLFNNESIDKKNKFNTIKISNITRNYFNLKNPLSNFYWFIVYFFSVFKFVLTKSKKFNKPIILIYPNGFFFDLITLILFKAILGLKVFYEFNELRKGIILNATYPLNPIRKIIFKFTYIPYLYLMSLLQIQLLRFYTGIIVISSNLYKFASKYNNNLAKIPILVDTKIFGKYEKDSTSFNNKLNIGYFGTIELKKEGLDIFIKSVGKIDKEIFCINLYGSLAPKVERVLEELISTYNLENNVKICGPVIHELVPANMAKQDLLVLLRPKNLQTYYGFSTKLAEYLSSGTPVLVTNVSDNSIYIKDGVNGFIINECTEDEIIKKIIFIYENKDKLKEIGDNGRNTAEKYFDYRLYSNILSDFLLGNNLN